MIAKLSQMLPSLRLPRLRIDSATLGHRLSYLLWRQTHGVLFEPNDDPPEIKANFETSMSMFNAGPMLFGQAQTMPQRYHRSPAKVARDGVDHYFLMLVTSGRFEGLHEGQPIEIGSGDAVLFQLRCVADIFAESSACFGVALPASILAPLLRDPDGVCGTVLKVGTPLCRVLFDYIGSLVNNAAQLQIKDAAALAQSTAAMIAVCFGPAVDASRPRNANLRTASLMVIKRYIDENMNNSQLDAAHLTSIFGLSRASIYRMFEPLGGVAKFIQRNRLRRALIQLSSDEYIHLQVSEMSHNLGFASPTNFSRAFKAQFGMLPSEVRRNPQAAIAALSNSGESAGYDGAAENGIDPLFAEWIHELG